MPRLRRSDTSAAGFAVDPAWLWLPVPHCQRRSRERRPLDRIRQLPIPPAWTDVWICPHANGHLQAAGEDTAGR
jgi:DNA topoisomerase-1